VPVGLVVVGGGVSYSVDVRVAVVPVPAVPGSLFFPAHNFGPFISKIKRLVATK
jgi:hypothetical protein